MSRLSFALTIAVLFGAIVVLSAFALQKLFVSGPGNEDLPEATEEMTQATETTEETTVQQGAGDLKRPPDSTLSYGGQEVRGSLGSFCWMYGNRGLCADTMFITPPRKRTLTVPSGSEMVFRYGGQRAPKTVGIHASALGKKGTSTASADPKLSRSLKAHGSGVERTIPVELPSGEYIVSVFVTESQGDATYYFRVMVE
jgi:hypothetical protein